MTPCHNAFDKIDRLSAMIKRSTATAARRTVGKRLLHPEASRALTGASPSFV